MKIFNFDRYICQRINFTFLKIGSSHVRDVFPAVQISPSRKLIAQFPAIISGVAKALHYKTAALGTKIARP
jgi:hypothetical protein